MSERRYGAHLADQDFLLPPDDPGSEACGTDPDDLEIVAATYRSIVDQDAFDDMIASWSRKLEQDPSRALSPGTISGQLAGQLRNARQMIETLDIPAENDPLRRAVSDVPGPAIVLSPDGRVATANVEGEKAFGVLQGVLLDEACIASSSRQDYAALRRSAMQRGNAAQAILTIVPSPTAKGYASPFPAEAYLVSVPGHSGAHVAIRSLEIAWSPTIPERLHQAFGLSAAEAEVAELFFRLRNLEKVAQVRGSSRLTVRTQIKSIMAKTGAPSNVDLMRLLAMVASRALLGQRGIAPVWRDPQGREQQIRLPGGRVVAWTWMGAQDGFPVVMLRGFPMTYLLPEDGEDRLRAAGICLYALSGPGYGNSTPDTRIDVLEDHLVALRAFLDHEIDRPCIGVGQSQGLMPLMEESCAHPARFRSLIAIGYTSGLDRSGIQRLALIQRTMMRMAASAPWIVELMAKTGHRQMREHGVDWYLERAYHSRPLDIATFRDPNISALMRNACEHLLKQGHVTFVRELQLAHKPMDHVIDALSVPLLVLAPTEDGIYDERGYRTLETRNPLISVEPVEGAGELIFYQRTRLILDRIIAAVDAARA